MSKAPATNADTPDSATLILTGQSARVRPADLVVLLRGVVDGVVSGELGVLRSPPGRKPFTGDLQRSAWFNALATADQDMAASMLRLGAFDALFDVCCLLDGVRAVDDDHGALRLVWVAADDREVVLNDPDVFELHSEFRGDGDRI